MRLSALAFAVSLAAPVWAGCTDDAMLVFDASGSMAETGYNGLSVPRIAEARQALRNVLPEVAPLRQIGLTVYGPGESSRCDNVAVHFPPLPHADVLILDRVESLIPAGNTALADAVEAAALVLGAGAVPATIVLVTDGKETCNGAPCEVAADFAQTSLTVHVIGFRVDADPFNWKGGQAGPEAEKIPKIASCLAETTGGLYVPANSVGELTEALRETLGCNYFSMLRD
ncbi:vWA domain-containing protein [Roseobacteraceae bacterium S113]